MSASTQEATTVASSGGETNEHRAANPVPGVEVPLPSRIKLDIACGCSKPAGWVGIDVAKVPGVDHVHDLWLFPWPIESGSVSEARCVHLVEHIPHRECPYIEVAPGGEIEMLAADRWARSIRRWGYVRDLWWDFWGEVYRICDDGAVIDVVTPYYTSRRADQDPGHERRICEESYLYLSQEWLARNRCAYPFAGDFEVLEYTSLLEKEIPNGRDREYDVNVVADLRVKLRVKKPAGRPPLAWWEINKEKASG